MPNHCKVVINFLIIITNRYYDTLLRRTTCVRVKLVHIVTAVVHCLDVGGSTPAERAVVAMVECEVHEGVCCLMPRSSSLRVKL